MVVLVGGVGEGLRGRVVAVMEVGRAAPRAGLRGIRVTENLSVESVEVGVLVAGVDILGPGSVEQRREAQGRGCSGIALVRADGDPGVAGCTGDLVVRRKWSAEGGRT